MIKFDPRESYTFETCVRAIDLIKVANELFKDNMQYAKLSITYCENEDHNGDLTIYAIPTASSDDVKAYPTIKAMHSVDIDTF